MRDTAARIFPIEDLPDFLAHDPGIQRVLEQRKREEGTAPPRAIDQIEAVLVAHGVQRMLLEPSDTKSAKGRSPAGSLRFSVAYGDNRPHSESTQTFVQMFQAFRVSFLRYGLDVDASGGPVMAVGFRD